MKYIIMAANGFELKFIEWLEDNYLNFNILQGCYKGTKEMSFKIKIYSALDEKALLIKAKEYKQESVLYLTNNVASLLYIDSGKLVALGGWNKVSESIARQSEAYTYDYSDESYYMAGTGDV